MVNSERRVGSRCRSDWVLESADPQAAGNALGIIQNETVQFSTTLNTVFNLLAYVTGGTGTVICHFVQRRFKLSVKTMLVFGVVMAIMPTFWAFLGNFTNVVGFHNSMS
jgi:MFS-type transporter involved in bile tolerance (Atg22 family)